MQNNGINLLTEPNASVRAIFQGVVTAIIDYFGTKVLIIKHGEYSTVYQNLSSVNVKKGDKITTKQIIGKVAKNNSNSTYELHFELLKNTTHLNPALWLAK
jgi:murein hydrolase activator